MENIIVEGGRAMGYYGSGGGFRADGALLTLRNSVISGNTVVGNGNDGGAFSLKSSQLRLFDSIITRNSAARYGGGIYDYSVSFGGSLSRERSGSALSHLVHIITGISRDRFRVNATI